ncbi:macro domain-containing protein [Caldicellulosiruptor acetigenus]|uniref:macro domain-containing protein n=1 Tax=Caldicellulosiruptor acetigenus TaxID=301953 RepID=UPI0001E9A74E|nr:macro domain-containing protein [Caldicellulosiruptor acetigenus]
MMEQKLSIFQQNIIGNILLSLYGSRNGEYFVQHYKEWGIKSVAFPKLGTNAGRLPWEQVKDVMIEYLSKLNIPVYICLDELEEAEGIEKEMVRILNENSIGIISSLQLRGAMRNYIISQLPEKGSSIY